MATPPPGAYPNTLNLLSFYWWVRGLRGEAAAMAGELFGQISQISHAGSVGKAHDIGQAGAEPSPGSVGTRNLPELAQAVGGLVGIEMTHGDGERAALVVGAAMALLPSAAADATDVARVAATLKNLVGDAVYASASSRGAAMTREQALAVLFPSSKPG